MEEQNPIIRRRGRPTGTTVASKPLLNEVELVSYAIKMVIPTGQYANIQPEIIVKSSNLEDAHAYCAGHMNKLWKEYFLINERRPEPEPVKASVTPKAESIAETNKPEPVAEPVIAPPSSSVSLLKATQAIKSCLSLQALDLIANQVEISVKLTNEDKTQLMPLLEEKYNELKLNGKEQ